MAQQQKSYLKDTTAFINFIEETKISEKAVLVSMDITTLYTNISQEEPGLKQYADLTRPSTTIKLLSLHLLLEQALRLILQENSLQFNAG